MIAAVVLAAGESRRMARLKPLLPIPGSSDTFLSRLVRTLGDAGVEETVVVTGGAGDLVERAASDMARPPRVVRNPNPAGGQLSSLQVALGVVDRPGVEGMLVALVDAPLVRPSTVRLLLDRYRDTRALIVRPICRGRRGHPVIFGRGVFDALRQAPPDRGAKAVLEAYRDASLDVEVDDERVLDDIDTPADYERAFGEPLP